MSALLDLARRHTRLAKAGRQWQGLCPFHEEKTPSFRVDPDDDVWFCFGCGQGGGLKDFARLVGEDTSTLPAPRPRPARRQPILMPWGWATGEEVLDYLAAQPVQEALRASLGWPCPPVPEVRQCFESLIAQEAEQRFTEALLPD